MISTIVNEAPILVGLVANQASDWRGALGSLPALNIRQIALFLQEMSFEGRRELYQALDGVSLDSIPYAQLPVDAREWELMYLAEKFHTEAFSLPAEEAAPTLIKALGAEHAPVLIENPEKKERRALFNDAFLASSGAAGICLDTAAFEHNRQRDKKGYEAVISTLDHNAVGAAFVMPVFENRLRELFGHPRRLSSLSDLHYLKHFPQAYLSKIVALKLDNSFEEQLEVKLYLESFLRKKV